MAKSTTSKTAERILALVFAVIVLVTLQAAAVSFALASGVIPESLVPAANAVVFGSIFLNGIFCSIIWFLKRRTLGGMANKKAYDQSALAVLSVFWDVVAALLAVLASTVTPVLYIYLGIALVIDTVTDIIVHVKR